eukprot:1160534-Pelagomonas_calceolata.AAC.30
MASVKQFRCVRACLPGLCSCPFLARKHRSLPGMRKAILFECAGMGYGGHTDILLECCTGLGHSWVWEEAIVYIRFKYAFVTYIRKF